MVCFVAMDYSSIMRAHEEVSNQIITCVFINMMYRSGFGPVIRLGSKDKAWAWVQGSDLGPGFRLRSKDKAWVWVQGSGLGPRRKRAFRSHDLPSFKIKYVWEFGNGVLM